MLNIANSLDFVKRQVEYYARSCAKLYERKTSLPESSGAARASEKLDVHERLFGCYVKLYEAMKADLEAEEGRELVGSNPPPAVSASDDLLISLLSRPTNIVPETLFGLPSELIEQLQISDSDRFQWDVVGLIDRTPEQTISLEVLLIALYRQTGKIYERADLANRVSRLFRKGAVYSVAGKKAWYTTVEPNNSELISEVEEVEGQL